MKNLQEQWYKREPPKMELSSCRQAPCSTGFPDQVNVLGTYLYQCTSWRCCERLCVASVNTAFLKILSTHLPIFQWVIYEHTCPHHSLVSAVFDQKQHDPQCPTLPIHPISHPANFFCFKGWEKSSKGNILPMWKKWNKTPEALQGIKIDKFKNCFEQWKNTSQ